MALIKEIDYGTPIRVNEQTVTLTIDGMNVTVPAGTSVMAAAMHAGTQIPKLCATDSLEPFGSCRLCLVEIEGRRGTPASCTTPVAPGIRVKTQTGRLKDLRRGVMEMYISDHPLDCLTCSANGDCELQDQAAAVVVLLGGHALEDGGGGGIGFAQVGGIGGVDAAVLLLGRDREGEDFLLVKVREGAAAVETRNRKSRHPSPRRLGRGTGQTRPGAVAPGLAGPARSFQPSRSRITPARRRAPPVPAG